MTKSDAPYNVYPFQASQDSQFLFLPHEKIDKKIVSVKWDNNILEQGDCVYLTPDSFNMKNPVSSTKTKQAMSGAASVKIDEDHYPEAYRKSNYVKGTNDKTLDPFVVACV